MATFIRRSLQLNSGTIFAHRLQQLLPRDQGACHPLIAILQAILLFGYNTAESNSKSGLFPLNLSIRRVFAMSCASRIILPGILVLACQSPSELSGPLFDDRIL